MEEPITKFIEATWTGQNAHVAKWDLQVVNWIFTLHAGGIAGGLTYAASKGSSAGVFWSLVFFAAGLLLIVIFGAIMIYDAFASQRKFHEVVRRYHAGEATADEVFNWDTSSQTVVPAEIVGWISGLSAIPGVCFLIAAIA